MFHYQMKDAPCISTITDKYTQVSIGVRFSQESILIRNINTTSGLLTVTIYEGNNGVPYDRFGSHCTENLIGSVRTSSDNQHSYSKAVDAVAKGQMLLDSSQSIGIDYYGDGRESIAGIRLDKSNDEFDKKFEYFPEDITKSLFFLCNIKNEPGINTEIAFEFIEYLKCLNNVMQNNSESLLMSAESSAFSSQQILSRYICQKDSQNTEKKQNLESKISSTFTIGETNLLIQLFQIYNDIDILEMYFPRKTRKDIEKKISQFYNSKTTTKNIKPVDPWK